MTPRGIAAANQATVRERFYRLRDQFQAHDGCLHGADSLATLAPLVDAARAFLQATETAGAPECAELVVRRRSERWRR